MLALPVMIGCCGFKNLAHVFLSFLPVLVGLAFADANVKLVTLTDYEHVVAEALETGYIKQEDVELLHEWRKDPANWKK